jgi:hypothetical protein
MWAPGLWFPIVCLALPRRFPEAFRGQRHSVVYGEAIIRNPNGLVKTTEEEAEVTTLFHRLGCRFALALVWGLAQASAFFCVFITD